MTRQVLGDVTNYWPEDNSSFRSKELLDVERRKVAEPPAVRGVPLLQDVIFACARQLLDVWIRTASDGGPRMRAALLKFGCMGPSPFVAVLSRPPMHLPPAPPGVETWNSLIQGDFQSQTACTEDATKVTNPRPQSVEDAFCKVSEQGVYSGSALQNLRASHSESAQLMPSADELSTALASSQREQIVWWLIQICALRNLPDVVLYSTVVLFDRYCTCISIPIPPDKLHLVVLSILTTSLKMTGGADGIGRVCHIRELLHALCQQQAFTVENVFATEIEVLGKMGFRVSQPVAMEFLEALALPFALPNRPLEMSAVLSLGKFLLQLSLFEAPFHYKYPHVVLAAGAIYISLWCTKASPAKSALLLSNVASIVGATSTQQMTLWDCGNVEKDSDEKLDAFVPDKENCESDRVVGLAPSGYKNEKRRSMKRL